MANPVNTFSVADYIVFSLVLAVSAGIGIFYGCTGGKQKTTQEFLMADRSMNVAPVALSLLASFMSAITLLGTPAEMYVYGTQYWVIWVGYVIMIPCAAHIFLPVFYNLKVTSVFEYLEARFGRTIRLCCAVIYVIQMTLYMAIVLYAPSLALNAVTGLNVWISVFTVGIVCTFYTTLGGMKAVMWTDTFQILCMFAGLLAVLVQGSIDLGGFGKIWQYMHEGERIQFFDFDTDPTKRHTVWNLVFGGTFTWLAVYGVNQAQVQRSVAVKTLRDGQLALYLNLPGLTALLTICAMAGMVVYAQYRNCDPLSTGGVDAKDQLLPYYVMDRLIGLKGLPGLFTASLFSGALSTISSGLNSLSAVTLQDLIRPVCFKSMSEERATTVSKILAMCYGILCLALTFVAAELGGVLQAALALFGMLGGPQLGVYTLGVLCPCVTHLGAMVGLFSSLIFTMWLGIGAQIYKPVVYSPPLLTTGCPADFNGTTIMPDTTLAAFIETSTRELTSRDKAGYLAFYEISYMWYSVLAVAVVCIVGIPVSYIFGANQPGDVDPKLLCPLFDKLCPCLPQSIRDCLRCHVDYDENDKQDEDLRVKDSKNPDLENGYINQGHTFDKAENNINLYNEDTKM